MSAFSTTLWLTVVGWFEPADAEALCELLEGVPEGGSTAHVGVYAGRHLAACADVLCARSLRVLAVDTWQGAPYPQNEASDWGFIREGFDQVTRDFGLRPDIAQGDSVAVAAVLRDRKCAGPFDLVFLDADHSYEATRDNIAAWRPLVKPGGVLCGHDYGNPDWPGVTRAVDELVPGARTWPGSTVWAAP